MFRFHCLSFMKFLFSSLFKWRSKGTKMVVEESHEKLVRSFRELLFPQAQIQGISVDDHTLLRFLKTSDFDVMKAKDLFLQCIKWREEFRVDQILKEFKYVEEEEVKKIYPHGFHGVDRFGRPVYIEKIGKIDHDKFIQVTTIDRFIKHHIYEQEKTLNWRYPACSLAAKTHIDSTLSILDVKDMGASQFSKAARFLFMEIQKIDSNYYPETLHQLFIVNAGSGFRVIWKGVKAFLEARTLAKIRVLGADYRSTLTEAIDPSEFGGCLFSDKGPWKNPEFAPQLQLHSEDGSTHSITSTPNNIPKNESMAMERGSESLLLKKVSDVEPILRDVHEKIEALEVALSNVKSMLQGVAHIIQDLKQLASSNLEGDESYGST